MLGFGIVPSWGYLFSAVFWILHFGFWGIWIERIPSSVPFSYVFSLVQCQLGLNVIQFQTEIFTQIQSQTGARFLCPLGDQAREEGAH
jgi:hypothetical protein